jgi:predicted aspartyl protease
MKKFFLIVVFGFYVNYSFSQNTNTNEQIFGGYVNNLDGTNETGMINYQGGYIFIEVFIQNKKYIFLFDTGSSVTVFSDEIDLKLNELSTITITDLQGNDAEQKVFQTDFFINGSKFNQVAFIKQDLSKLNSITCLKVDGILGANIIKKCNWKLDFKQSKIYFSKSAFTTNNFENFTTIKWQNDISPILRLKHKDKYVVVLLDTGYSGMLKLSNSVFEDVFSDFDNKTVNGNGKSFTTINSSISGKFKKVLLDNIEIGTSKFNAVNTLIDNSKPLLGNKIFGLEDAVFNFTENKIYIGSKLDNLYMDNDLRFCRNDIDKSLLEICFIWEKQSTKHLKIGDTVIKINDKDVSKIDDKIYCDIQNYVKINKNIKVTVVRNGKIISAIINE